MTKSKLMAGGAARGERRPNSVTQPGATLAVGARFEAEQTYDLLVASDLVTLYASARPCPVDGVDDGRRQELPAARVTYQEAREAVDARVPEGWQLLGLSTWPC